MANWIYPEDEYQESEARVFEERAQALLSRFRTVAPRTPFQRAAEEPPTVPPWQQGRFGGHEVEETAPSAPSDRFSRSLGAYGRSVLRETPNEIARDMRPLPAPIPVPGVPLLARGLSAIADPLLRAGQQGLLQGIRGIQEVQPLAEVGRGALEGLAGTRPDVSYGELRRAYGVRELPGPEVPVPGPLRGLAGTATFKPVDTAVDLMGEMTLDPLNVVPIPLAKGAKAGEALLSQAGPATQKAMRQLLDALPEAAYRSADDVATALRGAFTNLADDEVQAVTRLVDARARAFGEVYGLDPTAWYKRLAGIRPGAETGAVELAQQGLGPIKGAVRFLDDGRALITAFESHDVSTALHEFGHVFRRDLLPADLQRVESWVGITDGQWTVEAEERFARGFEQYLRAGESPVAGLQDIFAQFKAWLTAIYRQVQGSEIDVPVSPEVRQAFDSLLTTERPGGAVAGAGLVPSTGQAPSTLFQATKPGDEEIWRKPIWEYVQRQEPPYLKWGTNPDAWTDEQYDLYTKWKDEPVAQEREWQRVMSGAVAEGKIAPDEAAEWGWKTDDLAAWIQPADMAPLPSEVYHVTTARDRVLADRLRTPVERENWSPGLGGPNETSDYISVSSDLDAARNIKSALQLVWDLAHGQTRPADLLEWARKGADTSGVPYAAKLEEFLALRKYRNPEQPLESGLLTLDEAIKRDLPLADDQLFSLVRQFLREREFSGGPVDPVLYDQGVLDVMRRIDREQIAGLVFRPGPEAIGAKAGDVQNAEWRIQSGVPLGAPVELFQRGGIPARGHPDRIADYPSIAELKAWVAGKAPTGVLSTIQQLPGIKQVASAIDPMSTIRPTIPVIGDIPVEYVAPISRMLRSIGRQTLRQMDSELRAIDLSAYSIGDDGRWATGVTPKVPGASLALNDVLEHPGNYDFVNDNLREFVETFDQILTTANDRAKALGIQVHERELPAGEFYFPRIVQQVQEAVARTRTSPDMPRKFDSQEAALQSGVRYDTDLYAIANAALDYRLRQMETKYLGEVVSPMGLTPREIVIAKHPQTFATEDDAKRELGIARRGLNMLKAIKSGVDPYQTRQQADGSYVRTLRRSIRDMDQLTPGFSTMVKVLMANKGFASQEAQKAASGELSYAFQHLRTQGTQDYATIQRQVHQALGDYRQASQAAIRAAHDQMDASAGGYRQAMATAQQALDQQRAAAAQFLHETVNQYRSATELWGPGVAGSRKALKEAKAVIGEAQRALGLIDEAAEHQMRATSVDARGHLVEAITGLRQADLAARQAARAQADLALQMQRQSQLRTQAEALLVAQNALPTQRRVDLDPWRDLMDYVLDQAEVLAEAKRGAYETARKARESRMEKATKSEFEPGRVFERPEGTISTSYVDLPYLAGRRLPIEVAEYLKKHVVHHENTYDRWLQNINLVNGLVKATKAGFDFGVLGIHNAAVMIYKPKAYMRGAWALFEAMRDLRSYDEYVSDPALKPMLNDLTSNNFTWEGNEYTEGFSTIAGLAERLPEGLGIAKRVATGLARRAEAAFLVPLMVTKIEIAKALYPRFKAQGKVKELAEFLNDLTGTQSSLSQGIGESQRAVENLAVFSSRYTRSGFSMLGRTLQGGPAAAEARKALGAMFTGLPAILAGYAIASGQEITPDFFNPMSSHFLEVGVGNRRVSFGGFYFGFARLVGSVARTAAEGHPEKLVTASRQDNPLLRYATGRGSPLATLATTVATGRTYNNTPIEDAGDMAQELARTLIPLSVQDIVAPEEGEERPTPAAAAANAVGLRTLPYTESQRRDLLENQLAQERYGKSWDALDVDEQEVLRGDPKLRAAMRAALEGRSKKGDVQARFWLTVEDERKQIEAQIAEINRLNRLPTTNERHLGGRAYRERLAKLESQIAELPESLRRAPEYRGVPLTEEEKVKAYPGYTPSALPVADYVRRYHGLTKTHTDPVTGVVDVDALLAARRAMAETAPEGVRTRAEGHIGRKRDPEYREALKQYDEYQAMVTDSGLDREEWRRAERFNRIVADTMRTMTFGSREGRRRAAEALAAEVFPGGEDAYHLMRLFLRSRFGKQWVQERRQYWAERPLLQRYFTDAVLEEDAA